MPGKSHIGLLGSDLSRALITAQAIDASLGVGISLEPGLREHNLGNLQGLTSAEMTRAHRRDYERLRIDPGMLSAHSFVIDSLQLLMDTAASRLSTWLHVFALPWQHWQSSMLASASLQ